MSVRIKDKDKGYKKLFADLTKQISNEVSVGVFDAEASEAHDGGALTVGEIAEIHEYGLGNVPERSFIRGWFDENPGKIKLALARLTASYVEGKRTKAQALELFGQWAVGQIQARIAQGISPELKPATVSRKGSSVPLIDTGQLRASITYQVENGPSGAGDTSLFAGLFDKPSKSDSDSKSTAVENLNADVGGSSDSSGKKKRRKK